MRIYLIYPVLLIMVFLLLISFHTISHEAYFFDDFYSIDEKKWVANQHSFQESGSNMTKAALHASNSILAIRLQKNSDKLMPKIYNGGEIGSAKSFKYGKFSVRMKSDIRPGTVSSFFLMNEWKPKNWIHKEIDIEFFGKNPKIVQFTVHLFLDDKKHTYYKRVHSLGFDSSKDFHTYSIEWTKNSINWFVDDSKVFTETRIIPEEDLRIRMNHWCANPANPSVVKWLGKIDDRSLPSVVYYDWVKYEPGN